MKNLRRKRLNELLKSPRFNGDRAAFLTSSGLSKGRLTQLLNPDQPFGDTAARNLCEALDLPAGWFEALLNNQQSPQPITTSAPATAKLEDTLAALAGHLMWVDANKREAAIGTMTGLLRTPDDPAFIDALAALLRPAAFTEKKKNVA